MNHSEPDSEPDSEPPASAGGKGRPNLARGGNYLLTWTTYGTWLPGDERGFVGYHPDDHGNMVIHNRVNTTYDRDMPAWKARAAQLMTGPEVVFGHEQARVCEAGIREVAQTHDLRVHAAAIMRTHLHVVVGSPSREGEDVLKLFKGVLSRRLGQHFAKPVSGKWWTRHGSHRLLTNDASFLGAVRYILREQENPLAIITLDDPETRDQSPAG